MVEHLTLEKFEEEVLKSEIPVVIDFYADWCMPCKMMAPVFESLSKKNSGKIKFMKLNTEEEGQLAMQFGVQSIPTFVVMRGGKVIGKSVGYMDEDSLKERLDEILKK